MSKVIMVQGTMSNAGKSLLTAGLCRIFMQDGYRAAPFKSQNMALNSYITAQGFEIGRAQAVQAMAAGIEPSVYMNPILLKPVSDMGSQVIVNGRPVGNMHARDYFAYKKRLMPDIISAFKKLEEQADIIVIEGAGSPAEINLKADDIVNMGLAKLVGAPVLLVGDIDRGGVFAQLLGTLILLSQDERKRVKGLIINKFRGDKTILDPGIKMLEDMGGVRIAGVVPYMNISIEDEDSLSEKLERKAKKLIDLAVIRLPRLSNFTDFDVFDRFNKVSVRYVKNTAELGRPDAVFIPGSKNTISDLLWMRENGLEASIKKLSENTPIIGICGGFQMLGQSIADPMNVENGGSVVGFGLLPVQTVLTENKTTVQVRGSLKDLAGVWKCFEGCDFEGYEIHMGRTEYADGNGSSGKHIFQALICAENLPVCGSYIHGLFESDAVVSRFLEMLAKQKGIEPCEIFSNSDCSYRHFQETQFDLLADTLREYVDMNFIYEMLKEAAI